MSWHARSRSQMRKRNRNQLTLNTLKNLYYHDLLEVTYLIYSITYSL